VFIIVVVYFVMNSVRKLLDTPSYSGSLHFCYESNGYNRDFKSGFIYCIISRLSGLKSIRLYYL